MSTKASCFNVLPWIVLGLLVHRALGTLVCPSPLAPSSPVFFDTAPLNDFHIRVYQRADFKKFYFAPMALLDHTSAASSRNELTGERQMTFRVEMWTDELQHYVADYLSNVTGKPVTWHQVAVLPFDKVAIRCQRCTARLGGHWYSFAQSPKKMEFRMVCPSAEECHFLSDQMRNHPRQFGQISLHFLLERAAGTLERKTVSITGEHLWSGRTMADIDRLFADSPYVLVRAEDAASIIAETFENVVMQLDADVDLIVNPDDERRWKRFLENALFDSRIVPDGATALEPVYWNSERLGPLRPDTVALRLNGFRLGDGDDHKLLVERIVADRPDGGKSLSRTMLSELSRALETRAELVSRRLAEIREFIDHNGREFVPKPVKHFNMNLEKLRTRFKTFQNVSIKFFLPDLSLDLNIQPDMSSMNFDRNPRIPNTLGRDEGKSDESDVRRRFEKQPGIAGRGRGQKEEETGLFQTIRSAVTGAGLEIAPYTVLRSEEGYEERLYPAQKWVKTQLEHVSRDSASSTMFWKLFNFISGQNDKEVKIPMTAPVSVLIQPGAGPNCKSTFTMAFYIPAAFQDDTPAPTDPDVSIEERPEIKVFARSYGGFSNDRVTSQEHKNLWESLSSDDKQAVKQNGPYYFAGYDPPFKLFFRRNEIWMPYVEPDSAHDASSQAETNDESCE